MEDQDLNPDGANTTEVSFGIGYQGPQLRVCPDCKNQVHAASAVCPVCGKSAEMIRLRSLIRWLMLAVIVALVIFEFAFRIV
jgi:RNA polymerase subunit RPABC4/transcription elongation factor Spt4